MNYPVFFDTKHSATLISLKEYFRFISELYSKKNLPKVLMFTGDKGSGKSTLINHFLYSIFDIDNYNKDTLTYSDNSSFLKAITTVILADITMSLDNVLGVAGAAKDHYYLLVFGLVLSIVLMATAATLISGWIKKYKWIAWVGLLAVLIVAIELIYTDIKVLLL